VAIVDTVVDEHGTRELAKSYLEFLYTPEGQRIAAEHGNRVHDEAVAKAFAESFPAIRLVTVQDAFGGWDRVQKEHFGKGGMLERVIAGR
jgi:sulfate/thiosulfate transport system substrate-binding protein